MTLFFRTIGCLCPDFNYAIKFAAVIITLFVITSGYIIQYQSQQVWLRWIFYINVFGLGFAALMENEFHRLTMSCVDKSLIPNGSGYNNLDHQVCTLAGSRAGSAEVSGTEYVIDGFSYNPDTLWRNFGIMLALIAFSCSQIRGSVNASSMALAVVQ